MSDVRSVLAEEGRRVLIFIGLAVVLFGGGLNVTFISVVGVVIMLGGLILGDVVEDYFEQSNEVPAMDPLEELRARYARGELSDAEFNRRIDRLLETEAVEVENGKDKRELEQLLE